MRGRAGPPGSGWILPLLLLLPPAGNLLRDFRRERAGAGPGREAAASDPSPRAETAALRQLLRDKDEELQLLRGWSQSQPRYLPLLARTLQFADLSPRRSALWLWGEGLHGVNARTAVVYRGTLVGCVERVWTERGLVRVQTIRDRYFRVRFRYGKDAWGFLSGTPEMDPDGRPILEISHLRVEVAFREGDHVYTDGDDGRYPGGIPIGTLFRIPSDGTRSAHFKVRGEFPLDRIPQVVLLVDRATAEVRSLLGKGSAE